MVSSNGSNIIDNRKIKLLTLQFLKELISNAKGQLVTFRPAKIAQEIASRTRRSPRAESVVIRNFFEELVEYKLIHVVKKSARGKVYGIYRNTVLWNLLEHYDAQSVLVIIESIIKHEGLAPSILSTLNNLQRQSLTEAGINERAEADKIASSYWDISPA